MLVAGRDVRRRQQPVAAITHMALATQHFALVLPLPDLPHPVPLRVAQVLSRWSSV